MKIAKTSATALLKDVAGRVRADGQWVGWRCDERNIATLAGMRGALVVFRALFPRTGYSVDIVQPVVPGVNEPPPPLLDPESDRWDRVLACVEEGKINPQSRAFRFWFWNRDREAIDEHLIVLTPTFADATLLKVCVA